jgi:UDPglucose 6-dehydrogenase
MSNAVKIAVIGSGYVGLVATLCFAEIGHSVVCVDKDAEKIKLLNGGGIPIYEDHLAELLSRHLNRRARFTTELRSAVEESDAIFIAVGTPQGASGSADLSYVEAVVNEVAQCITTYKVLIEKSTVPVYTNEWITRCMDRHGIPREKFSVVSNPEFLREGTAVRDFLHPDRIVVGADHEQPADLLRRIYEPLTSGRYYASPGALPGALSEARPARLLVTSAQSAELIKHASNAFLAMKISFINAVANLAELVSGNIEEIAAGMGMDSRIGDNFLRAGLGYGGSCFPKDVAAFSWVARQQGVDLGILEEVRRINAGQQDIFFNKVRTALWTLRGKKIAALGLSFKGGTDDIRESPAVSVIRRLLDAGCSIFSWDPVAMDRAKMELPPSAGMHYASTPYEAAAHADAVLLLTDWPELAALDLDRLGRVMRFRIVVDGRNLYRPDSMLDHGFTYFSMGRPAVHAIAPTGKDASAVVRLPLSHPSPSAMDAHTQRQAAGQQL